MSTLFNNVTLFFFSKFSFSNKIYDLESFVIENVVRWPRGNNIGELPVCRSCGEICRPAVVLFDDNDASLIDRVYKDGEVYQKWECDMEKKVIREGKKVCILEIGCGTHVPSVRMECEQICQDLADSLSNEGKNISDHLRMIRINPELGQVNEIFNVDHIPEPALDVLRMIDQAVQAQLSKRSNAFSVLRGGFANLHP